LKGLKTIQWRCLLWLQGSKLKWAIAISCRLLEEEIKGLHRDLLYLKDQILLHSRCDDEAIRI
jgi:hypothetical protein